MRDGTEEKFSRFYNAFALLLSVAGSVLVFVPFALHTSALDAVMLNVPGEQGNWWHFLIGAPVFLAFPMLWLRLRAVFAKEWSTAWERRIFSGIAIGLLGGTYAVLVPFLVGRAGTSPGQRWAVIFLGYGIPIAIGFFFWKKHATISATRGCLVALNTAYLANAGLCLPVYEQVPGTWGSKPGWLLMFVLVWPMLLECVGILARGKQQTFEGRPLKQG